MTAPATLAPAAVAGVASVAYAMREHESTEETIALAGGAAAVALGAALLYEEQNYWAGIPLVLIGGITSILLLKRS